MYAYTQMGITLTLANDIDKHFCYLNKEARGNSYPIL